MRIGVLSDTHGSINIAIQAINKMGPIDALIHAGDFYSDALHISKNFNVPLYAVLGNCDAGFSGVEELLINLEGCKIYITHGHLFRAKSTLQLLYYKAQETSAGVVVFGHTHVPVNIRENGILLFNPGSTTRPQGGSKAGYGILSIDKNNITGELCTLD
ncbi:metallophosphoesterase [Desulfoscipio geothermicus]|uniref:Phosphoesterase n=1 Tax=Desulfoscipio geothermicus DSM 3669 TaxID=1121426 RepID=A0A1I6E5R7_9FIRM|nr:metallophosphoesterase [Desulfoscipio geothermicus]SFR12848.1 hypothetical protein SAMN05660706_12619 [Desulfoscipio geothermicus DSM 3669]